jgi:hypothetical protein
LSAEDIEVRYKEFPKSELLEIHTKPLKTGTAIPDVPEKEALQKREQPADDVKTESSHQKKAEAAIPKTRKESADVDKRSLLFFLAGFLTAGGIIGVYFLLKSFF